MSRTPVRSALHRLQQEGFIASAERGRDQRLIVTPLTQDDGRELFLIVGHLEGLSAHLADCRRCTSEQASFQAMRGAFRDLRHVDVRAGLAEQIIGHATAPRGAAFLRIPRLALIPVAASVMALCLLSGALGWRLAPDEVAALGRVAKFGQRGLFNRVWQHG